MWILQPCKPILFLFLSIFYILSIHSEYYDDFNWNLYCLCKVWGLPVYHASYLDISGERERERERESWNLIYMPKLNLGRIIYFCIFFLSRNIYVHPVNFEMLINLLPRAESAILNPLPRYIPARIRNNQAPEFTQGQKDSVLPPPHTHTPPQPKLEPRHAQRYTNLSSICKDCQKTGINKHVSTREI